MGLGQIKFQSVPISNSDLCLLQTPLDQVPLLICEQLSFCFSESTAVVLVSE